ncbi:hypothetical protein GYMLUDRAFT_54217 [Collybiopsis luxurians FD-317 M1]|nr:hypothetical protein GYMLUDRAFT_54217 [Collybiopsis luxurians FD-317 M1]
MGGQSYDEKFWQEARSRSLEPGGFEKDRVEFWAKLLNVELDASDSPDSLDVDGLSEHPDERQIRLDTDRSFVMYPDGDVQGHQESLNRLLVSIFRRHPSLSYFQGFHDIMTVLFLTLPPHLRLPCAEKVSLHRTRDAMGEGLEPVLGLLRFLSKLLAVVDADLARLLRRASPLPYFALSHLLTMFSHDVPTLPLIQHIFDYLLARPPIALVYLVAAVIIEKKEQLITLNEDVDGDLGMLHSLLGALPQMSDESESSEEVATQNEDREELKAENERPIIPASEISSNISQDNTIFSAIVSSSAETATNKITDGDEIVFASSSIDDNDTDTLADTQSYSESDIVQTETETEFGAQYEAADKADKTYLHSRSSSLSPRLSPLPQSPSNLSSRAKTPLSSSLSPSASQSHPHTSSDSLNLPNSQKLEHISSPSGTQSPSDESTVLGHMMHTVGAPIPLSDLLRAADSLIASYPPYQDYPVSGSSVTSSITDHQVEPPEKASDPSIGPNFTSGNYILAPVLSSFMGPHSVIYTWSEDPEGLPNDSFAEEIVRDSSKVVIPWDPSLDIEEEDEKEANENSESDSDIHRRRLAKRRRPALLLRSEVILGAGAGAVLFLAIALAMYNNRSARSDRLSLERVLGLLGAWVGGRMNR